MKFGWSLRRVAWVGWQCHCDRYWRSQLERHSDCSSLALLDRCQCHLRRYQEPLMLVAFPDRPEHLAVMHRSYPENNLPGWPESTARRPTDIHPDIQEESSLWLISVPSSAAVQSKHTARDPATASSSPSPHRPLTCLGASSNPMILFSGFLSLFNSAFDLPILEETLPAASVFSPLPAAVKVVVPCSSWARFLGMTIRPECVVVGVDRCGRSYMRYRQRKTYLQRNVATVDSIP